MKHKLFLIILAMSLLAGCGAPVTEVAQPPVPSATSAPAATELPAEPTAEPTLAPTAVPQPQWVGFIGNDGNLRLVDRLSGELRQLTSDAASTADAAADQISVSYHDLQASSDGQLLAYRREIGQPVQAGYSFTYEVWVYELASGEQRQLMENLSMAGMAWRPGTHWLSFAIPPDEGYFASRGQVDSSKARGIWAVSADTGENMELVRPENGYSLRNPRWSPDGMLLAYEEIWTYEGSGYFAYSNFAMLDKPAYVSWGEAVGIFDWSPDGKTIAYDALTYVTNGTERIYLRPLAGGQTRQLSPDYAPGSAFWPRFSPSGQQVAYQVNLSGTPDSQMFALVVQPVDGGEPRQLGLFDSWVYPSWLPDESGLVLSTGPFETRQVFELSLADGSLRLLADGNFPVIIP